METIAVYARVSPVHKLRVITALQKNDNFASIVAAVEEGRGIFGNIEKYLMFLRSSNLGEIGLLAEATLLGLPPDDGGATPLGESGD